MAGYNHIHCLRCRIRVASARDYILTVQSHLPGGIFTRMSNVEVSGDVNNHRVVNGNTLANTNCVQCGMMLGWRFIAVPQRSTYIIEGRFYMILENLCYCNDVPLHHDLNEELDLGANEENSDQDGDANEENSDQDGDANEENADQVGDAKEQDVAANEQNADHDGDAIEQVPNEQDVDANEQNADQDIGGNEQNHDQDGGASNKRRKM